MSSKDTEKEQLAQIKTWIYENGLSITLGIIVGLGGVYGWKAWEEHRIVNSRKISTNLYDIIRVLDSSGPDTAEAKVRSLLSGMSDGLYADIARLLLARSLVEQGKLKDAAQPLAEMIDRGEASILVPIARVRLARIYIEMSRFDEAGALLAEQPPTAYAALYEEVQGDIHYAQGNIQLARESYLRAQRRAGNGANTEALRMKIDGLSMSVDDIAHTDTTTE